MKNKHIEKLKEIAPLMVLTVTREIDRDAFWDGDGPDPSEDGFSAYNVDVRARLIANGEFVEGRASLGGSWYRSDEPLGDVHGYLLQLLDEAIEELKAEVAANADSYWQLQRAVEYLKTAMRAEYDAQRAITKATA